MKKHYFFLLMLLGLLSSARAQTQTFTATGGNQTYTITSDGTVTITATGGSGGDLGNVGDVVFNKGGSGSRVSATFDVKNGDNLIIVAGSNGAFGGGGGGSAVILQRTGFSNNFLLVAGAGGGAAMFDGTTASQGSGGYGTNSANLFGGGSVKAGGGGGGFLGNGEGGIKGGKAGTLQGGGNGGTFGSDPTGFGFGGGGAYDGDGTSPRGGGGGGGGYRGGDGGAVDNGGDGGTSFVSSNYGVNNVQTQAGVKGGGTDMSGSVVINFVALKPTLGTPSVTNVTCNSGSNGSISASATSGTPPYTFSLNPAAGNQSFPGNFTGLAAGSYTLTVTDANGKSDSKSNIQVNQPSAVTFTTTTANVKCFGGSDGSITVTPNGGTPPYRFSKDGGTSYVSNQVSRTAASSGIVPQGFTFTGLSAGTYSIRVKDANNCETAVQSVIVSQPTAVSVTPGPDKSVIRGFGSSNSTCTDLSANASGGTPGTNPAYTYVWMPGNLTGPTVNVCPLETTTYTVTATDANGCTATATQTVKVQDVRCGPGLKNVSICYYGVTQCVSESLATRYLKLGATLGACGSTNNNNKRIGMEESNELPLTLSLKAYPNPATDAVTVEVLSRVAGMATLEVLDATGRARQTRQQELTEGLNVVQFKLGSLPTGIYLIRAVDVLGHQAVVRVNKQ